MIKENIELIVTIDVIARHIDVNKEVHKEITKRLNEKFGEGSYWFYVIEKTVSQPFNGPGKIGVAIVLHKKDEYELLCERWDNLLDTKMTPQPFPWLEKYALNNGYPLIKPTTMSINRTVN